MAIRRTKNINNKTAKKGLGSIAPKNIESEIEERNLRCEQQYEEILHGNANIISSFSPQTYDLNVNCEEALHDLLNLEKSADYLSESRLSNWRSVINNATLFKRLLIYISISYELPKTKGMTQAEYFSEFFGMPDYEVSKTFKKVQLLVFLYLDASNITEVRDLNLLMNIGNENDHALEKLLDVQKQNDNEFLVSVFKECQKRVETTPALKKITGSLVEKCSQAHATALLLEDSSSSGAVDSYESVELSQLISPKSEKKEDKNSNVNLNIPELTNHILEHKKSLSELTKGTFELGELQTLQAEIKKLYKLAKSISAST